MAATGAAVSPGVVVALLTVYLVWGSTYLAIKYVVAGLPPFLAMGVRFLLAGTVLLAAVLALRGRDALRMTRAQLGTAAVCGLFLLVGGNGVVAVADLAGGSGAARLQVWLLEDDRVSAGFYESAGWAPDGWARTLDTGDAPLRELRWHALLGSEQPTDEGTRTEGER